MVRAPGGVSGSTTSSWKQRLNKKLVLLLLAVVLLVAGAFVFLSGNERGAGRPVAAVDKAAPPVAYEAPAPVIEPAAATPDERPAREETRVQVAPAVPTAEATHAELAGLTGRVVESDGTPVVAIRVALLEF